MAASEAGIDRAARLILSGRAAEALVMLKAVHTLHHAITSSPVTEFGLAHELDKVWTGLQDLESRIDFTIGMNDRMVADMREAGVLQPVLDHLRRTAGDPDAPQPPPTN